MEVEALGDKSFAEGDFLSAQMYYLTAFEQFSFLYDEVKVQAVQDKYYAAKEKSAESFAQKRDAQKAEADARAFYADKNFEEAKANAMQAKELYTALGMKSKVAEMDVLIQQISVDSVISNAVK